MTHEEFKTKRRAYMANYRTTPKSLANTTEYLSNNRERIAAYGRTRRRKLVAVDYLSGHKMALYKTPRYRFQTYVGGAKLRHMFFELTFEQFMTFWQKPCHYCGDSIRTIGLDRLDNMVGYTMTNVVACCTTCNIAKLKQSPDGYVSHCQKVVHHHELHHQAQLIPRPESLQHMGTAGSCLPESSRSTGS